MLQAVVVQSGENLHASCCGNQYVIFTERHLTANKLILTMVNEAEGGKQTV